MLTGMRAPRSLWSDAWRRLRRNKMAMVGLVYLPFWLWWHSPRP